MLDGTHHRRASLQPQYTELQKYSIYFQGICTSNSTRLRFHGTHAPEFPVPAAPAGREPMRVSGPPMEPMWLPLLHSPPFCFSFSAAPLTSPLAFLSVFRVTFTCAVAAVSVGDGIDSGRDSWRAILVRHLIAMHNPACTVSFIAIDEISRRIPGADTLRIDRTILSCSMLWGAIAHLCSSHSRLLWKRHCSTPHCSCSI